MVHNALGKNKITFLVKDILIIAVEQVLVSMTPEESKITIMNSLLFTWDFFLDWIGTASDPTLVNVIALITDFNYTLKIIQYYRKSFKYRGSSESPSDNM